MLATFRPFLVENGFDHCHIEEADNLAFYYLDANTTTKTKQKYRGICPRLRLDSAGTPILGRHTPAEATPARAATGSVVM